MAGGSDKPVSRSSPFVSHDRSFIRRISGKTLELDRGNLTSWNGGYDRYLVDKQKWLEEEARKNALFDKKKSFLKRKSG